MGSPVPADAPKNGTAPTQKPSTPVATVGSLVPPVRKQFTAPVGKLSTTNIGINETLNPTQRASNKQVEEIDANLVENFSQAAFDEAWQTYCVRLKLEGKDSLFSTLQSKVRVDSEFQIHLELQNVVQKNALEIEKNELLHFLRQKLRNAKIGLSFKITEVAKVQVLDNKGVFEKLSTENSSLDKFRKLFNLDIEF